MTSAKAYGNVNFINIRPGEDDDEPLESAISMATERSPYAIYNDDPPPGVPVLDVDPFSEAYFDNPYPVHEAMRDAGPYVWLSRYGIGAVARYEEVRSTLGNWQDFCSSRGVGMEDFVRHGRFRLPSLLIEADPPAHTQARGVVSRVLSPAVLSTLRETFKAEAEALVESVIEKRQFDAVLELARAFPLRVFPDAMGMSREGRDKLLPHAEALFNSFGPRNAYFQRSAAQADFAWVERQGLRENLQPGGLGMMVHDAADKAGVAREDASKLVRALLQAGLDTTVNALGATFLCLARFPSEWDKLRADPDLAKNAFEEAIRFESPVQVFFRTATRNVSLGGVGMPEGAKLLMVLAAANRDPRHWSDADRYDISRRTIGHVGFGSGVHACVGQLLARMEGEILLKAFVRRVARIEIIGEPTRSYNNTLRGLASLPVAVTPA